MRLGISWSLITANYHPPLTPGKPEPVNLVNVLRPTWWALTELPSCVSTKMVQLKRDLPEPGDRDPDNTYWAIGDTASTIESWKSQHSDCKACRIDDIIRHNNRKERGLLNYLDCSIQELKNFILSRRIKLPFSKVPRVSFTYVLEKADEERTFSRFLDLPRELRDDIYAKYFDALPVLPLKRHQPPLTQVSSLIRKESLSLYYSNCTFTFAFDTNIHTHISKLYKDFKRTDTSQATDRLLSRISDSDFARIRNFRLQIWEPVRTGRRRSHGEPYRLVGAWDADLSMTTGSVIISKRIRNSLSLVDSTFGSILEVICARPGAHKLLKSDCEWLRWMVHLTVQS